MNSKKASRLKNISELLDTGSKVTVEIGEPKNVKRTARYEEEDGSDLSIDLPGQGMAPSKLREYELGNENAPSKLQEADFDETPALPSKESFENDRSLQSKSKKDALRSLRNRAVRR